MKTSALALRKAGHSNARGWADRLSATVGGCFFFKQKTAYGMRISDWSSDVCSSDLPIASTRPRSASTHATPKTMPKGARASAMDSAWRWIRRRRLRSSTTVHRARRVGGRANPHYRRPMTDLLLGSHVAPDDPLGVAAAEGAGCVPIFLGDPPSWQKPAH